MRENGSSLSEKQLAACSPEHAGELVRRRWLAHRKSSSLPPGSLLYHHPLGEQLLYRPISSTRKEDRRSNTYRRSLSAQENCFDAKSPLLRRQSERPVVRSSITSPLGKWCLCVPPL